MLAHLRLPCDAIAHSSLLTCTYHRVQPALGGDAKTLMFVNVAPAPAAAPESLCSLRFAAKVHATAVCWLQRAAANASTGPGHC
jgi:hypothetical protein